MIAGRTILLSAGASRRVVRDRFPGRPDVLVTECVVDYHWSAGPLADRPCADTVSDELYAEAVAWVVEAAADIAGEVGVSND